MATVYLAFDPRFKREEFGEAALAWYDANKGKSTGDLARLYLEQGNSMQKQFALQYLMYGAKTPEDFSALEAYLLAAENPEQNFHLVQLYVGVRDEKARDFVEKFIALV